MTIMLLARFQSHSKSLLASCGADQKLAVWGIQTDAEASEGFTAVSMVRLQLLGPEGDFLPHNMPGMMFSLESKGHRCGC